MVKGGGTIAAQTIFSSRDNWNFLGPFELLITQRQWFAAMYLPIHNPKLYYDCWKDPYR